jgi:GrpB-like predicted nucleotidyltransferase (UPF0157 family)
LAATPLGGKTEFRGDAIFIRGVPVRTHHVHAFAVGDEALARHLAFRDYLRTHAEIAREYGELKQALARTWAQDPARYVEGKDALVKRITAQAMAAWRPQSPA